ncbi:TatD family hydrolase [Dethiobacter alkaliphilus]|uniref:Hydrolase, TatD family n=1 Tax=Dethiobacter alkaliphilus AHT 1 TaxID=555088 RepID=C0GJA8_DETAL|nr:TatD family hydrolase [Dethiobacter alkaliphilus]EEG76593.1 hydrolase, TatD family [Dethiobacter alkaliphilus AHT 1]
MLIDTHAHLNDKRFSDDLPSVLERAKAAGVEIIINVGYDLASSENSLKFSDRFPQMYAAVGIHPHEAAQTPKGSLEGLRRLAVENKVVALGEMGLDYYYDHSPRPVQQEMFRRQIRLALELDLPVIVHDRDAHHDVLTILREEGAVKGVMHCFSGDVAFARQCLDLGFYLSLAGPVTFKNAKDLAAVAREVPLERLLLETDAPYLAPVPYRGKRNEPAHVAVVAQKVAEIRETDVASIARQTTENAKRLFNLPKLGE